MPSSDSILKRSRDNFVDFFVFEVFSVAAGVSKLQSCYYAFRFVIIFYYYLFICYYYIFFVCYYLYILTTVLVAIQINQKAVLMVHVIAKNVIFYPQTMKQILEEVIYKTSQIFTL